MSDFHIRLKLLRVKDPFFLYILLLLLILHIFTFLPLDCFPALTPQDGAEVT